MTTPEDPPDVLCAPEHPSPPDPARQHATTQGPTSQLLHLGARAPGLQAPQSRSRVTSRRPDQRTNSNSQYRDARWAVVVACGRSNFHRPVTVLISDRQGV